MKHTLVITLTLLAINTTANADSASVYDLQTGEYRNIDIDRTGHHSFTVFDYEDASYKDVDISGHGPHKTAEVYDYETSTYHTYDLERTNHDTFEVTDPYSLRTWEVELDD